LTCTHTVLAKVAYDADDYDGSDVTDVSEETEPVKTYKYHHLIYKAYYEELDDGPSLVDRMHLHGLLVRCWNHFRLSWKDLSYIRHSSPAKFEVVYQQKDMAEDNYLINRTWATGGLGPDGVLYPGCIDNDRQAGYVPEGLVPPVISIASVDPSPTMFWALQWWLYQPSTNLRYLIDVERVKLTAEDLLGYNTQTREFGGIMEEWQNRSMAYGYPISHWIVEINAAQRFLLAHDFVRKWQALHGVQRCATHYSSQQV
jgi:hypothetical protein